MICNGNLKAGMTQVKQQAIKINVRYFAQARELAGRKEEQLEIVSPSRVQDLISKIMRVHPNLSEMKDDLRVIVNGKMTDENLELNNGDSVVLFPPIAGGRDI